MGTYQIDGVDMNPQPTEHQWEYPIKLGNDGDGRPFYAKYSAITLRVPLELCQHLWFEDWLDTSVVSSHSITVPRPGTTDDFTTYAGVFIDTIEEGVVLRQSGMRGVEMVIIGIEVD